MSKPAIAPPPPTEPVKAPVAVSSNAPPAIVSVRLKSQVKIPGGSRYEEIFTKERYPKIQFQLLQGRVRIRLGRHSKIIPDANIVDIDEEPLSDEPALPVEPAS